MLAAGTAAQASFSTVSFALAVLAPALRDAYDLSLTEIGIVLAAEWVGLTFALLPWGFAVDRFGERCGASPGAVAVRFGNGDDLTDVVRALDAENIRVATLTVHEPTLDDVFLAKTGRSLEGAGEEEDAPLAPGQMQSATA